MALLRRTHSLCPVCLRRIPAALDTEKENVFLRKRCPDHGDFSCLVWEGAPDLHAWTSSRFPLSGPENTPPDDCPRSCGLCEFHEQRSCTVVVEVTERCRLGCPVCFADAGSGDEPDFATLETLLRKIRDRAEGAILQLSGGEPTERSDLPELLRLASGLGFPGIQLNTNGLRLAEEPGYARRLREAGLGWVFLQFDGLRETTHLALRGRHLGAVKTDALRACAGAELGVVLVPTLQWGVNDDEIGDIVRYGLSLFPTVRGVHFQPLSFFGRYPDPPRDETRLTLPRILRHLVAQTGGLTELSHFRPSRCEHERCSFRAVYLVEAPDRIFPVGHEPCCGTRPREEGPLRAVESIRRRWGANVSREVSVSGEGVANHCASASSPEDDLDRFLRLGKRGNFSISAMAFQDAENLDLERLRFCCVHAAAPDGRLVPFCAWNLTARDGTPLHRRP